MENKKGADGDIIHRSQDGILITVDCLYSASSYGGPCMVEAALSNNQHFLDEMLEILSDKKIGLVRADSGFYSHNFLRYFENRKLPYIVAVKMLPTIKKELQGVKNWISLKDGIQVCEFMYQSPE